MSTESAERYRTAMAQLAALQARYERERRDLSQRHDQARAAAEQQVRRADEALAAAQARVRSARALVQQADEDSAELWHTALRHLPGRLARQSAALPEPVPVRAIAATAQDWPADDAPFDAPAPAPDEGLAGTAVAGHDIATLLSAGYDAINRIRRRGPLPALGYPLLAVLSVLSTALAGALAWGVMQAGHGLGSQVVLAFGRILLLLGCFAGLPAAKWYTDREGARFSPQVLAVVLGSGIVTVSVLALKLLL